MPDPYLNVDGLADTTVEAMSTRLEERANHAIFSTFIEDYAKEIPCDRPIHLLEVGTGTGIILRKLQPLLHPASKLTGIDISSKLLAAAKQRNDILLSPDNPSTIAIEYIQNIGNSIPFPNDSFDVVVLHTLLSHVPDIQSLLQDVNRVVKSRDIGGKVIIFEPDHASTSFGQPDLLSMREMDFRLVSAIATHPDAARQIPRYLKSSGMKLLNHKSYLISEVGHGDFWLSSVKGYAKILTAIGIPLEIGDAWVEYMLTSHEDNAFFAAGSFYTYIAEK